MSTENAQGPNSDGATAEAVGRSSVRRRRSETWWMISREGAGGSRATHVGTSRRQALALFGFAEEAALYLRLAGLEGDGWWVRESVPERSCRCSSDPARAKTSWPSTHSPDGGRWDAVLGLHGEKALPSPPPWCRHITEAGVAPTLPTRWSRRPLEQPAKGSNPSASDQPSAVSFLFLLTAESLSSQRINTSANRCRRATLDPFVGQPLIVVASVAISFRG